MSDFATLLGDGDGPAIRMARQTSGSVRVTREGEVVALQIGNSIVRFKHQDAMRIGQWLMNKAYEAKVLADDKSRLQIG